MKYLFALFALAIASPLLILGSSAAPEIVKQSQIVGSINVYVPGSSEPVKYDFKNATYSVESGTLRPIPFGATNIRFTKGSKIITFVDALMTSSTTLSDRSQVAERSRVKAVYVVVEDFVLPNLRYEKGLVQEDVEVTDSGKGADVDSASGKGNVVNIEAGKGVYVPFYDSKGKSVPVVFEEYQTGITFPSELLTDSLLRGYVNPFNVLDSDITDGN